MALLLYFCCRHTGLGPFALKDAIPFSVDAEKALLPNAVSSKGMSDSRV